MTSSDQRTVLVTGASGGIGAAIASHLTGAGWRVFRTMRHPDPERDGPDALVLDVTSDDSVGYLPSPVVAAGLRRRWR